MASNLVIMDGDSLKDITMVLVGCTGSGKSATGNSILGRKAFKSISSFGSVTTVCKLESAKLQDERTLKVIDTPGLFDTTTKPELVEKEIVRCIQMAKDGIHAILIVVSLKIRFTEEQVAVVETLKHLFGTKIVDYMIVTFTGGDQLDEDDTLDHHLATCPPALKDLLEKCGNRRVVFDNKTKDQAKKDQQLQELLTLIGKMVAKNDGKKYTHDLFVQFKNEDAERNTQISEQQKQKQEEQMQLRIAEMVQEKLKEKNEEAINKLKQDLERVQREANERKREQGEARNQMQKLREELEKVQREAANRGRCIML